MLVDMKITEFLKELASDSPAPGGGAAAALSGAMGAALAAMYMRLTIGKKNYEDVEDLFKKKLEEVEALRKRITELTDEDADAFNEVMAAFKLPKNTEEEKEARKKKIQEAFKKAATIPLETCKACRNVIDIVLEIGLKGNKNVMSDAAAAALCALNGLKTAALNVEINIPFIKDEEFVNKLRSELDEVMKDVDKKVEDLVNEIRKNF